MVSALWKDLPTRRRCVALPPMSHYCRHGSFDRNDPQPLCAGFGLLLRLIRPHHQPLMTAVIHRAALERVNSGFLQHCSFQSRSSFAEVPNLCTVFPDVTSTTTRSRRNRFRNFGSLRKIFVSASCVVEFTTHSQCLTICCRQLCLLTFDPFLSFPYLLLCFHSPSSYRKYKRL